MLKDLESNTFAQQARADIEILHKLETVLFIVLPHGLLEHASLPSFNFIWEVHLEHLQENSADISINERNKLIKFNVYDATLMSVLHLAFLTNLMMQWDQILPNKTLKSFTGGQTVRVLKLSYFDQCLQENIERHERLVLIYCAKYQIYALFIHQACFLSNLG